MYNVSRKDYFCLLNMLDAIEKIKQYCVPFVSVDDFYNDTQAYLFIFISAIICKQSL